MKLPTFGKVKVLLLVLGTGLALAQALVAWERGAPPTEVLAPVLYIPVFTGAIFFGIVGGLVAAAIAALLYLLVLVDQSSALGTRLFVGLFVNRAMTFAFYGVVVALGTRYVEGRLRKLELYDQIDDDTELYNAAFFLEGSDLEITRARRYRSIFSVVELRIARDLFQGTSRRSYQRTMKELARLLRDAVRSVDRPARVADEASDRFLIILPETDAPGSAVLTGRLETAAREFLQSRGLAPDGSVSARAISIPDQQESLAALRQEVAMIDSQRRALAGTEGALA